MYMQYIVYIRVDIRYCIILYLLVYRVYDIMKCNDPESHFILVYHSVHK